MDVEKLVDELRIAGAGNPGNIFDEAANVLERLNNFNESQCAMLLKKNAYLHTELEQLKRERDAAISDIPHKCWSCGKGFHTENGFDCDEAHYRSGYKDCLSWRWRGQKEEQ